MANKKFIIEKEVEYKNGKVDTWYFIKLETTTESGYVSTQVVDLCKDDETKANELFETAINNWVPNSKTVIKEVVVE